MYNNFDHIFFVKNCYNIIFNHVPFKKGPYETQQECDYFTFGKKILFTFLQKLPRVNKQQSFRSHCIIN